MSTRRAIYCARVPVDYKGLPWSGRRFAREFPEPAVASLVRIRKRGLVAIVPIWHGASSVGARAFWVALRRLVQPTRQLVFYGVVTTDSQVNCYRGASSGLIVETGEWMADQSGKRWSFSRAVSRLTNRGFRLVRTSKITVGTKRADGLAARWHLGGHPFFSCTVAGGL